MATKKLFCFPGAHKTGTSLLQAMLETHRGTLEGQGFSIARRNAFYGSGMRALLQKRGQGEAVSPEDWHDMREEVFGEDADNKDVIISIENMFGEANPPAYGAADACIENLQNLFPDHKIKILFYIRRQDTFLESIFVQNTHRGHSEDVESFMKPFSKSTIDWMAILRPVIERLGAENVKIRAYEEIKLGPKKYIMGFFKEFSNMTRREVFSTYETLGNTNRSLSELGLRIARAGFEELPDTPTRRKLALLLQQEFGVDKYPPYRLPDHIRNEIIDRHKSINGNLISAGWVPEELKDHYQFIKKK